MENSAKEELNLAIELKKHQELIGYAVNISEKILQILRGAIPRDDTECMKDECLLDTLRINGSYLSTLEKNLNEIARKIMG